MSVSLPITTRPRAGFLSYHTDSSTRGKENTRPKNQRHFNLGWQILKTMLRRYEALGGAAALSLSKRVAGLLSMVFYAKATNPQELVDIEMGNQA